MSACLQRWKMHIWRGELGRGGIFTHALISRISAGRRRCIPIRPWELCKRPTCHRFLTWKIHDAVPPFCHGLPRRGLPLWAFLLRTYTREPFTRRIASLSSVLKCIAVAYHNALNSRGSVSFIKFTLDSAQCLQCAESHLDIYLQMKMNYKEWAQRHSHATWLERDILFLCECASPTLSVTDTHRQTAHKTTDTHSHTHTRTHTHTHTHTDRQTAHKTTHTQTNKQPNKPHRDTNTHTHTHTHKCIETNSPQPHTETQPCNLAWERHLVSMCVRLSRFLSHRHTHIHTQTNSPQTQRYIHTHTHTHTHSQRQAIKKNPLFSYRCSYRLWKKWSHT